MANALFENFNVPKDIALPKKSATDTTDEALTFDVNKLSYPSKFTSMDSLAPDKLESVSEESTIPSVRSAPTMEVPTNALTAKPVNSLFAGSEFKAKTLEEMDKEYEEKQLAESGLDPKLPADPYTQHWGQKMFGTQIPLDQMVRMAGMAAKALDPKGFGGRLGADLQTMGHEAYNERIKREHDLPNALLRRRLNIAQIKNAELKETPTPWKVYYEDQLAQGVPKHKIVENYNREILGKGKTNRFFMSNDGQISIYSNSGELLHGPGGGRDITEEVGKSSVGDDGTLHLWGKTGKEIVVRKGAGKTKSPPSGSVISPKDVAKGWKTRETADGQMIRENHISNQVQVYTGKTKENPTGWRDASAEEINKFTNPGTPAKPKPEGFLAKERREQKEKADKEKLAKSMPAGASPQIFTNKKGERKVGYILNGKKYDADNKELN